MGEFDFKEQTHPCGIGFNLRTLEIQSTGHLEDAIGPVNFEEDGITIHLQQVVRQLGAPAVPACEDAWG
jgi:hypothetical protein